MSRIGKKVIALPKGVKVDVNASQVGVTGPKGAMSLQLSPHLSVTLSGESLSVLRDAEDRVTRAQHGLMRNLLANMVKGVTTGFERRLDISGVGFKAEVASGKLTLNIGFSHPVVYEIPSDIEIMVEKQTKLIVRGKDAQRVGQVAAVIRGFREPDAYKAKGIRYENEVIKVKAGKTGSK